MLKILTVFYQKKKKDSLHFNSQIFFTIHYVYSSDMMDNNTSHSN